MRNIRWIAIVAALVLAAGVGVMAYNAGVAHGIAQSGKIVTAPPGAAAYPYGYYPHPWHFGFFGPLLFIFFWFVILRGLFWRGGWHRGGGPCHHHDRYRDLDEWHRQAHERGAPSAP